MRNSDGVREERTGWRDEWISTRHRQWGWDCPAADIDFLMVEYNMGQPVAVVDYKGFQPRPLDLNSASFKAVSWLASMGGVPFMVVFYNAASAVFMVRPVNRYAERLFKKDEVFSEQEYVARLYELRRCSIPQTLFAKLSTFNPKRRKENNS